MKSPIVLTLALCLVTPIADAADNKNSESSASSPRATVPSVARPSQNSAADAADNAQEPGKLRPEHEVIPQIVLPLRGKGTQDLAVGRKPTGIGIDQQAARCVAQKTKAERESCIAKRR